MAIQVLTRDEVEVVSGGAITVGGPGLSLSLDPFALLSGVLGGVFSLVGGVVSGVLGLVTGLLGSITGLLGGVFH